MRRETHEAAWRVAATIVPAGILDTAGGGGLPAERVAIANAHYPLLGLAAVIWAYPHSPPLTLALQWLVAVVQSVVGIARQDWRVLGVRDAG